MKIKIKTTYLILGASLMLSSCSEEEMPCNRPMTANDRRITFLSSLPEVTSRAKDIAGSDMTYFRITAFDPAAEDSIKNGILFEYIKNDTIFKDDEIGRYYSEDCLWPEVGLEDHVLHFFAYYPHLADGTTIVNNTTAVDGKATFDYKIENFRIASDITDHIDFITAYAYGSMDDKLFEGVKLEFQHKLSRIEVKAKSENKSCKLEIAGIRIGGIHTQGTYNFKAEDRAGDWTLRDENDNKGNVEYVYRPGDKIVALNNTTEAVSIMGGSDGINYAMLLPSSYTGWNFGTDNTNSNKGMYISVLLRVLDKTPSGNDKQQYPYYDNSQGLNAMNIPKVYLAVDNKGIVTANPGQLYKDANGNYFTDLEMKTAYIAPQGSTVKEFGWAALPVTGDWVSGYAYTYTLDYTSGVGLHDPSVGGSVAPKAGDPVISDRVGVSVSVNDWQGLNGTTTRPVVVPGS